MDKQNSLKELEIENKCLRFRISKLLTKLTAKERKQITLLMNTLIDNEIEQESLCGE